MAENESRQSDMRNKKWRKSVFYSKYNAEMLGILLSEFKLSDENPS